MHIDETTITLPAALIELPADDAFHLLGQLEDAAACDALPPFLDEPEAGRRVVSIWRRRLEALHQAGEDEHLFA